MNVIQRKQIMILQKSKSSLTNNLKNGAQVTPEYFRKVALVWLNYT